MADVLLIEKSTAVRSHTVWLRKAASDSWGDARDGRGNRFTPNRACVIVTESAGTFESHWMQVRRHYYGDPAQPAQEMCAEVATYEGYWIADAPWAMAVRDLAVEVVKEDNR